MDVSVSLLLASWVMKQKACLTEESGVGIRRVTLEFVSEAHPEPGERSPDQLQLIRQDEKRFTFANLRSGPPLGPNTPIWNIYWQNSALLLFYVLKAIYCVVLASVKRIALHSTLIDICTIS